MWLCMSFSNKILLALFVEACYRVISNSLIHYTVINIWERESKAGCQVSQAGLGLSNKLWMILNS